MSSSPFAIVWHPLWKEFFKELQPSYKLRNRKAISTTSFYLAGEVMKIMKEYGEHKFVVLIGDNARNMQGAF